MPIDDKSQDVVFNGHSFKRVKMGLDEKDVLPVLRSVIEERDELAKRQEKSPTLTRFIEKIATEADDWAEQTKKEAREKAAADARTILSKAEAQAAQYIEEKRAEAKDMAAADAKAIISSAEEQAAKYLKEKREETLVATLKEAEFLKHQARIQVEAWVKEIKDNLIVQLRSTGGLLNKEMRAQADELKQRAAAFETDFEKQLAELKKRELTVHAESLAENKATPGPEAENTALKPSTPETRKESTATSKVYTLNMQDTPKEKKWVEIQIASGEADEINALKFRLDQQSEIGAAQVTRDVDRTAISVFLRKPVDLVQKLMSFPEVKQAQEIVEDEQICYRVVLAKAPTRENMKDALREQLRDWSSQR